MPDPGSESVDLATLRRWCAEYETTLRGSFGPSKALPPEWEKLLGDKPADTAMHAVGRFALLKHFYLVRQKEREGPAPEDAQAAARQLLRREPVAVQLDGRTVHVTARSYAAMHQIAAHAAQIRSLEADLEVAGRLAAAARARLSGVRGWRRAGRLRRRIRRLEDLHVRAYRELHLHRRALYAHALTPSGAPAASPDEAPDWWREIDPAADALLLAALVEAGHGRFARLGEPPKPRDKKDSQGKDSQGEDFGWASLFASVERQQKLEPAALYDADFFQLRAWLRAGAPPEMDD